MSGLSEAEGKMDGGLGAGILRHVEIHSFECRQFLSVLQQELADPVTGPEQESATQEPIQACLQIRGYPRRAVRIGRPKRTDPRTPGRRTGDCP